MTLEELSQLLWAAQGKNRPDGRRTIPSARAANALDVFLVAGSVDRVGRLFGTDGAAALCLLERLA